jgi:hypothetical protein
MAKRSKRNEQDMPKIDVKTAVKIAMNFMHDLFSGQKLENVMLEEVELTDDYKFWLVTLGFDRPTRAEADFRNILVGQAYARSYKVIRVNAQTGKAESMKMREV